MAARKVDLPDAENPSIMIRTTRSDGSPPDGSGGLGGIDRLSAVTYSTSCSLKSVTISSATSVRGRIARHDMAAPRIIAVRCGSIVPPRARVLAHAPASPQDQFSYHKEVPRFTHGWSGP